MFAEGADEVGGEFVAYVFVAADLAAVDMFACWGRSGLLWLGFDVLLIVVIGGGGDVRQNIHIRDGGDKEGMGAQVDFLGDVAGDIGIGAGGDDGDTVGAPFPVGIPRGLRVPAVPTPYSG